MVTNANLQTARQARDDEFYTKYADVDAELSHYAPELAGRRVYCGADGPESMFVKWMIDHWATLGLAGLTATRFNPLAPLFGHGERYDWTRPDAPPVVSPLYDGDLLGDECRTILDGSDVFVSNPPFSLMRLIMPMLAGSGKRFCVLGTLNMLKYNGTFDLILTERLWTGVNADGHMAFDRPDGFEGVAGVPLSVFCRLRAHDPGWRVVGKMDSSRHLSAGRPVVDGRKLFTRVLIERRPDA